MTEATAAEIHKLFAAGKTRAEIARILGTPWNRVADVISGRTWTHIKPVASAAA